MKKLLLFSGLLVLSLLYAENIYAQKSKDKSSEKKEENTFTGTSKDGKEVVFKLINDEPENTSKLYIGIVYLESDASVPVLFALAHGLEARYSINDKFILNGHFSRSLITKLDVGLSQAKSEEMGFPNYKDLGFINYMNLEAGATTFFKSRYKTNATGLSLKDNGRERVVLKFPYKRLVKYGLRTGYVYAQESVSSVSRGTLIPSETYISATMTHNLFAGLSIYSTRNIAVESQEFGLSSFKGYNNFYTDLFFSPAIKGNFYNYADFQTSRPVNRPEGVKTLPLGLRLGYEVAKNITHNTYSKLSAEVGVRPGFTQLGNAYLLLRVIGGFAK